MSRTHFALVSAGVFAACAHSQQTSTATPAASFANARSCATGLLKSGGYEIRTDSGATALRGERRGAVLSADPARQVIDEVLVTFSQDAESTPPKIRARPVSWVLHGTSASGAYREQLPAPSGDARNMAHVVSRDCGS